MGSSVVAGIDAVPVLEITKHVLDCVAASVEDGIMRDGHLAAFV